MIKDPSSLEATVDDMSEYSDKELAELKERVGTKNRAGSIDLRAYEASQQGLDERSGIERLRDRFKQAVGLTPERELNKLIDTLSSQHATYVSHVGQLSKRVEEQGQSLRKVSEEHSRYHHHASIVVEQYERLRTQVDRLETEVEQSGSSVSVANASVRERLMSAQTELRLLRHEADQAIRGYTSSKRRYNALSEQHQLTSAQLSEFKNQEHHIGLILDDAILQRDISVDGASPSLMRQYKELAKTAQDVQKVYEKNFSSRGGELGIDTTYGAPRDDLDDDSLTQRWDRLKK